MANEYSKKVYLLFNFKCIQLQQSKKILSIGNHFAITNIETLPLFSEILVQLYTMGSDPYVSLETTTRKMKTCLLIKAPFKATIAIELEIKLIPQNDHHANEEKV